MSLPKRERAMCLFNVEVLRAKIADAKMVLEVDDTEDEAAPIPTPETPQAKKRATVLEASPQTPDLSSRGPSATASPTPVTPVITSHTIASLARLPASQIIELANSTSATGLPLPKADPAVIKATDEFVDSLEGRTEQMKKQAVGEKIHRNLRAQGVKKSAKIAVAMVDSQDLRSLVHLLNSYPSVLKEKAIAMLPDLPP